MLGEGRISRTALQRRMKVRLAERDPILDELEREGSPDSSPACRRAY